MLIRRNIPPWHAKCFTFHGNPPERHAGNKIVEARMKRLLLGSVFAAAMAVAFSPAQATWLSIDDMRNDRPIHLWVNSGDPAIPYRNATTNNLSMAGTGTMITPANAWTYGILSYNYSEPGAGSRMLSFTFKDQDNWGESVFEYRYFTDPLAVSASNPHGYSDLFIIQGLVKSTPDHVTFIDSDKLTGNLAADLATFHVHNLFWATPEDWPTLREDRWMLAYNTGVDQYYVNSTPEPASLALLGAGLLGLGLLRRRRA